MNPLIDYNLSLVAPLGEAVLPALSAACLKGAEYTSQICEIQRFRGSVLVADGAIPASALDAEGRQVSNSDCDSWHILSTDHSGALHGCIRLRTCPSHTDLRQLAVGKFIERIAPDASSRVVGAVRTQMIKATESGVMFGEVGGWAVDRVLRKSFGSIALALSCWSLYQILGRAMPIATATTWHGSSKILRRLGGFPLQSNGEDLAPVFDPFFQCEMEVLGFDSDSPAPRYAATVQEIKSCFLRGARPAESGAINPVASAALENDAIFAGSMDFAHPETKIGHGPR